MIDLGSPSQNAGRQLWFALALLLAPASASAGSADIEHRCTARYPNVWQYFAWKDCVKTATQEEREESLKRQREEAARPCLAADISRMEGLAAKASGAVKSEWSLEEAQAALSLIIGYQGTIEVASDNIKERVLVHSISTKCDASFYFLINLRADQDQRLRWFRIWAEDPPSGYSAGRHQEFSVEFEEQRQQERYRAEAAKREEILQAAINAEMAKQEREREEARQMTLRSVKISDVKMKCLLGNCSIRSLDFLVTNVSQEPINEISFGWMLPSSQMKACPSKLAIKETKRLLLQPGEKTPLSISILNAPENNDGRYCLSVTNVDKNVFPTASDPIGDDVAAAKAAFVAIQRRNKIIAGIASKLGRITPEDLDIIDRRLAETDNPREK